MGINLNKINKPEPDYAGFNAHVEEWDTRGFPWNRSDLVRIARRYNTPIPEIVDGKYFFPEEFIPPFLDYASSLEKSANEVVDEVHRAKKNFPENFSSAHEAYAVILEEMDELWELVKAKKFDPIEGRKEAKQVAAMCLRLMVELT